MSVSEQLLAPFKAPMELQMCFNLHSKGTHPAATSAARLVRQSVTVPSVAQAPCGHAGHRCSMRPRPAFTLILDGREVVGILPTEFLVGRPNCLQLQHFRRA